MNFQALPTIDATFGIPDEYWAEVDAACQKWLDDHGIKLMSVREQIHHECMIRKQRNGKNGHKKYV